MSKTVLAQVDGFTPLIDGVVADVGVITAAVFGKAWRYCQMSDGVCKAAQERIADELGLTRPTVNAHLKKLCEAGYLKDNTPDLLGLPHEYADTGKANLSISFTGSTTTCKKDLQPPVKNIDTKKEVKKELYKDPIIEKMYSMSMVPTAKTLDFLDTWRAIHSEEKIILALEKSRGKTQEYADTILRGWEKNGYPKTKEERIASSVAKERQPAPIPVTYDLAGIPESF